MWTAPLDKFCEDSNSVAALEPAPGKFRHVAEALATVAWFHSLKAELPDGISQSALEPYLAQVLHGSSPAHVENSDKSRMRRNKWRGYRDGCHTPDASLVHQLGTRFPGTEQVFSHCLWSILDPKNEALKFHRIWRSGLDREMQGVLLELEERSGSDLNLNAAQQCWLLMRAPLDSVAVFAMLLRRCVVLGEPALAFTHAASLTKALVIHWDDLAQLCIAEPMSIHLDLGLLARAANKEGWRWTVEGIDLAGDSHLLSTVVGNLMCVEELGDIEKTRQMKVQVLSGACGLGPMHALNARLTFGEGLCATPLLMEARKRSWDLKLEALEELGDLGQPAPATVS